MSGLLTILLAGASCRQPTGDSGGVRERWYEAHRGERAQSRPAVAGDVVYFGTREGALVARDRATGARRWSATIAGTEIAAANILARSGVVVAAGVRQVVGVDAASGTVQWRYDPPLDTVDAGANAAPGQVIKARLDADADLVFVPAWGASVSAVELSTGRARWVWQAGKSPGDTASSGVFRSGADGVRVSGDTVFATVWHSLDRLGLKSEVWLVTLDRTTGRELWRVVIPSYTGGVPTTGAPALYGNLVIFATIGGRVWAVDRTTRAIVWRYEPPARYATLTQVEAFGDALYVDGGDERLHALRAADGSLLWTADIPGGATRDLLVTERRVYCPSGGKLYVLNRADGQLVWTGAVRKVGDAVEAPPAFAAAQVFVSVTPAAWSFDEP